MGFQLTEEQKMMQRMVRDFAQNEIAPFVETMEEKDEFPLEIIRKMGEYGLMGIPIPEEYGGSGADFKSYILTINEIAKVSATVGVILSVHTSVGTNPILYFGTEEQKQKYIPKLASGQYIGAFALTEPNAGSDAGSLKTTAVKKGDKYILNGSKVFITNGGAADTYITFALTNPAAGSNGISAFIVEKDTPGFTVGKKEKKMGLHGSNTTELIFENAEVPAENLLGQEGEGFKIAMANLDVGRIGIAAQALGIAEAALQLPPNMRKNEFSSKSQLPQTKGFPLKSLTWRQRWRPQSYLVYQAADLRNRGIKCGKEASMAKRYASDTAMKAAIEAVQIHGGYGYTEGVSG